MPLCFAYGSNLSSEQMAIRCPGAKAEHIAELLGYRLDFTRYSSGWGGGVADVVLDDKQSVWGLIYSLSDQELTWLDEYEGYPDAYDRFQARVLAPGGRALDAWVYAVANKQGFIPPTASYLSTIKSAAAALGFPDAYRALLQSFEIADPT